MLVPQWESQLEMGRRLPLKWVSALGCASVPQWELPLEWVSALGCVSVPKREWVKATAYRALEVFGSGTACWSDTASVSLHLHRIRLSVQ